MYNIKEKKEFTFLSDDLSFEELNELELIKKEMLKWEYYNIKEVFNEL